MVLGIQLVLQPVIQIAFNSVLCNRHASALLQDDSVQFELCKGVLKILTQIRQVGSLLFGVSVVFPECGNDLSVGRLCAAVIDQKCNNLLGFGILECDRL